jgi:hypothetical protein
VCSLTYVPFSHTLPPSLLLWHSGLFAVFILGAYQLFCRRSAINEAQLRLLERFVCPVSLVKSVGCCQSLFGNGERPVVASSEFCWPVRMFFSLLSVFCLPHSIRVLSLFLDRFLLYLALYVVLFSFIFSYFHCSLFYSV